MISVNIGCVFLSCVFAVLSCIVGIVGTSLDIIGFIVFDSIEGCLNSSFDYFYAPGYDSPKYVAEMPGIRASGHLHPRSTRTAVPDFSLAYGGSLSLHAACDLSVHSSDTVLSLTVSHGIGSK
jgi:hypothetical protein